MNIKKLLSGIKYKLEDKNRKLVTSKLCNITLQTTPGTIRTQVDQDDAWFFYLARHHEIIFDIGCNVGYTALLALIQDPHKTYLMVDPNPYALNEAHLNLISNNLGFKTFFYSGFVSNTLHNNVKFYTIGSGAAGSMYASHAKSASAINSFTEVQTVTLDYLSDYYNLTPHLVKIDVEGAETLVMEGAYQLAKDCQCTFFIEMHSVKDLGMEEAGNRIISWCKEVNYRAWYLKEGKPIETGAILKERGKCHLLLLPIARTYPEYLIPIRQNHPLPDTIH